MSHAQPLLWYVRDVIERATVGKPVRHVKESKAFEEDSDEEATASRPAKSSRLESEQRFASRPSPFQCHLSVSTGSKGHVAMRYVEIPLAQYGLELFHDRFKDESKKWYLGKSCCFLKLGTSLVVTGIVSELRDKQFCVIPDKGQHAEMEWVDPLSLYCVPDTDEEMTTIRADVYKTVVATLLQGTVDST